MRCPRALLPPAVALLLAACGGAALPSPTVTPAPPAPPATVVNLSSPRSTVSGFLAAAGAGQDVGAFLAPAPSVDQQALAAERRVVAVIDPGGHLFWEVAGLSVTRITAATGGRAQVTLSGPIVWCVGTGPTDSAAVCSRPITAPSDTYDLVEMSHHWFFELDPTAADQLASNPTAG